MSAAASPSVVVACVAEDSPRWYGMVENLLVSLRNFGGALANAPFVAHFVSTVDESRCALLRDLGAEIRVVDRFSTVCPPGNKLRMFEQYLDDPVADVLLALDCDVIVVGDLGDLADPRCVSATPARLNPLDPASWSELLGYFDLSAAPPFTMLLPDEPPAPAPYLNTGVLALPAAVASALVPAWVRCLTYMVSAHQSAAPPSWAATTWYLEQLALSCALLEHDVPLRPLGSEFNYPATSNTVTASLREASLAEGTEPKILHYHRNILSSGVVGPTDIAPVNRKIRSVNRLVDSHTGRRDGRWLWRVAGLRDVMKRRGAWGPFQEATTTRLLELLGR